LVNGLQERLRKLRHKSDDGASLAKLQNSIHEAISTGLLTSEQAERMVKLVEAGKLKAEVALARIKGTKL
jgi:hypothetical protein